MVKRSFARVAIGALTSALPAQFGPGPVWLQEPPIGGVQVDFSHVDPSGALTVFYPFARTQRIWRHDGGWQEVHPPTPGPNVVEPVYAYDSLRQAAVLVAGVSTSSSSTTTYEYDGNDWAAIATTRQPPVWLDAAMAFDPVRQVVVHYGGRANSGVALHETWLYDGNDWAPASPATVPRLDAGASMVFDVNLQEVLLVGSPVGAAGPSTPCETWSFDGTDWTRIQTANAPGGRTSARLAHDPARGATVLFGGQSHSHPAPYVDTWSFDGLDWTPIGSAGAPAGYIGRDLTYWPRAGGVVCVGGTANHYEANGAITGFDGTSWQPWTADVPFSRYEPYVAFDCDRQCIVLHGGTDYLGALQLSTWEWRDGQGWLQTSAGVGPDAPMVYDERRQCIVAVDGGETWEYRASGWTAIASPLTPAAESIWYDRIRERVFASDGTLRRSYDGSSWSFAGITPGLPTGNRLRAVHLPGADLVFALDPHSGDTWKLEGGTWQSFFNLGQTPRSLAVDALRGELLMSDWINLVHYWSPRNPTNSNNGWLVPPTHPHEGASVTSLVGDPVSGSVYGVGIHGEIWRLRWLDTPSIARFGRSCPLGVLGLDLDVPITSSHVPPLGADLPLLVSNLPASPGFYALGIGETVGWPSATDLPVPLDALGLPGCEAWILPTALLARAHLGFAALDHLTLPSSASFAGIPLGLQVIAPGAGSSGGWGSTSNAVVLVTY